jgi:hypothetical protein
VQNSAFFFFALPRSYALIVTGKEKWGANLHFIRTSNVPPENVQACIECRCPDSDPPLNPHGELQVIHCSEVMAFFLKKTKKTIIIFSPRFHLVFFNCFLFFFFFLLVF